MEQKFAKSIAEETKMRLEDILETSDVLATAPVKDIEDSIKFSMNMIGRDNFQEKLEKMKGLIGSD